MLLSAEKTVEELRQSGTLCWFFKAAAAGNDMSALGAAAALAVPGMAALSHAQQRAARIGLAGYRDAGKTTFAHGLIRCFNDRTLIEQNDRYRPQATWRCSSLGWLRHYDAGVYRQWHWLPSYALNNATAKFGLPLIDIVEHPEEDMHNTRFDCLVAIDYYHWLNTRDITVFATPEIAEMDGFQAFLSEARPFAAATPHPVAP